MKGGPLDGFGKGDGKGKGKSFGKGKGDKGGKGKGKDGKGKGKEQAPPNENIFVTGLPVDATAESVQATFGQYGTVVSAKVLPVQEGKTAAAAFVQLAQLDHATWIVENIDRNIPQGLGVAVRVQFATPKEPKGGKDGGKGGSWGMMKGGPMGGFDGGKGGKGGWGGDSWGGDSWGGGGGGWGGDSWGGDMGMMGMMGGW
eukprot:TRINITY_DN83895_c0_g1_i1.p1 TRINITY_DN83895_c0_g1~~TRINITY_DN83895_c0_g1_i1.p1  ORF type:complete len:200 (-),score=57.08 TRINITY_DN83895_c0_g1_i1:102-701(-)